MTTLNLSQVNSLGFRDAALVYASLGIPVFPLQPDSNAPPLVQFTTQATTDPERIRAWWDLWPNANVGLRMGGQWHALDLDQKDGRNGWLSYLAVGGPAHPPWPVQETPSGGRHLLWRGEYEGLSNFTRRGSEGGVDMRTHNGYIAASPSVVRGKRYRWVDGNPDAGVPESLLTFCRDASRQAAERSLEAFPQVDPAPLSPEQMTRMVDLLGADHARFLTRGEGTCGDDSKDAYHACLRAFSSGWTLADMAAIGPLTYLGIFGGQRPHNATDPWAWCWRYTVRAAWLDWKKRAPGEVGLGRGGEGSPGASHHCLGGQSVGSEDTPTAEPAQPQDVYRLLEGRITRLPLGDYPAAEALLAEIHAAGMPESRCQALLVRIKEVTGVSLGVLRQGWREVQERARQAREARASERREKLPGVWVRDQGRVLDRSTLALISRDSFLTVAARQHGGDRQEAEQIWLQGAEALCESVESITYDPGLAPGVVVREGYGRVFNLYTPSKRLARGSGRAEDVAPWLYLLDSMEWEEKGARDWLLDRFAFMVQRPGVKVNHGVVIGGAKGIGKDSLLAPVIEAVGRQNTKTIDGAELLSDFNDYLAQSKLVVCNEIDFGTHRDRRTVAEKLKRVLAAPPDTLRVNAKNIRPYEIPNVVSFLGMTNHRICMHLDEDERRYLLLWAGVVRRQAHAREWQSWFSRYWEWLEQEGGHEAVLAYLRVRDISRFQPGARPPVTGWHLDIAGASRDGLENWLLDQITEGEGIWQSDMVYCRDVLALIESGAGANWFSGPVDFGRLGRAMHAIGARKAQKGGKRRVYWITREEDPDRPSGKLAADDAATVVRIEQRLRNRRDKELAREARKGAWRAQDQSWY